MYGGAGYRSPYLSHAKRALYHLSYTPWLQCVVSVPLSLLVHTNASFSTWPWSCDCLRRQVYAESVSSETHTMGPVAQRITRLTTDQKIPGSNPGRIVCVILCSPLRTTFPQHFGRRGLPGPLPPCSPAVTSPCRSIRPIPWALPKDNAVRATSLHGSIGGSVVECSPATRAARVRFPADAICYFCFPFFFTSSLLQASDATKGATDFAQCDLGAAMRKASGLRGAMVSAFGC